MFLIHPFKTYLKSSLPMWEPGKVVGNSTDGTGQINTDIRKVDLYQFKAQKRYKYWLFYVWYIKW